MCSKRPPQTGKSLLIEGVPMWSAPWWWMSCLPEWSKHSNAESLLWANLHSMLINVSAHVIHNHLAFLLYHWIPRQRASIASCGACVHYSSSFAVFHACRYSCLVVLTSGCQTRNGKLVAVTVAQPIPCQLVQLGWMAYITHGQCKV